METDNPQVSKDNIGNSSAGENKPSQPPQENAMLSLACNFIIPAIILSKFSTEARLGTTGALIVGLAFPIGYFIYDYNKRKVINKISILGFVNVLLTGVFAFFELSGFWFAVKEACLPLLICLAVILTANSKNPLINMFLYNPEFMNTDLISTKLSETGQSAVLRQLLKQATYLVSIAFIISAFLQFFLAYSMVRSTPGSEAYIQEIGKFTGISWLVIAIPSTAILGFALWRLFAGLGKATGLKFEQMMRVPDKSVKES